jgi:GntR family transcriptional regulator
MPAVEPIKPLGPPSARFLYRAVAEALRERIRTRVYGPGSRIPTFAELAAEFNVSTITVRHAIRELSLEGMLVGRQGLGVGGRAWPALELCGAPRQPGPHHRQPFCRT